MRVVEINRSAKTYRGPWEWHDNSVVSGDYMLLDDALANGFTLEIPATPVPVSVSKWAFLLTLRRRGKEDALKAAIAAYNGTNADRVRAKWDADPDIERNGATINALGAAIGYTPDQVDDLFRESQRVEAGQ